MNRDTQFTGFARILAQEIDEQVGAVVAWGIAHDIDDEAKIGRELASRWQTLLARRAYDFACHIVGEAINGGTYIVDGIPDMTAWPPDQRTTP